MKRLFGSLCILLFTMTIAYAACGHEEAMGGIENATITTKYEQYTSNEHWQYTYATWHNCPVCGASNTMLWNSDYFPHKFSGDKCTQCGYKRSGSTSNKPSDDTSNDKSSELPSTTELQDNARELSVGDRNNLIGAIAKVVYVGNVRAEPSDSAVIIGKIQTNEEYPIMDFERSYNGNIWLKIEYGQYYGWISASLAAIVPSDAPNLAGQQITVTIVSGNVRSGPGVAENIVGTIYRGEKYTILDCDYDPFGYVWYQIRVGYVNGWISSGLAEIR